MRSLNLIVLLLLLAGCGTLMGDRFSDFRAYYNTFYNAEKAFDDAIEGLSLENEPIEQSKFVRLRPSPAQVTRDDLLDEAIAKSADILRDHNETRWVYPALLLIGKAYLFQENYAGAEQNFREIIDRDETRREEAHAWLARTLLEAEQYDDALAHVEHYRSDVTSEYRADLEFTAATIHVRRGDWQQASVSLLRAMEEDLDRLARAHAYLLLGQIREADGLHADAAQAYAEARALRASDKTAFHATIGEARAHAQSGDFEEADNILADALREQRYPDDEAALHFWRGYVALITDDPENASSQWQGLLDDPDISVPANVAGRTHHRLGELFRDRYQDYTKAADHFEQAAAALDYDDDSSSWLTDLAVTGSKAQADRFSEVAEATNRFNHLDSLLALGEMDEESYRAFVEETRAERLEELEQAQQAAAQDDGWGAAGSVANGAAETEDAVDTAGDDGFLFYRDPTRVQEIQARFETRWGNRPHVPNWRRQEAVTAPAQRATANLEEMRVFEEDEVEIRVVEEELGLDEVPRDAASRESMRRELAEAQYQLGNALFLSTERPDSAIYWYEKVLESEYGESVELQAMYAKGEAHSAMERHDMARPLYEEVASQSEHPALARRAAQRLGDVEVARQEEDNGEEGQYEEAYARWQQGYRSEALEGLLAIYSDAPGSQAAPRSLLAAGQIAIEMVQQNEPLLAQARQWIPDSLRVTSGQVQASTGELIGLAHALWEELAETYPRTQHARRARYLVAELQEPERRTYLAQRLDGEQPPIFDGIAESSAETPEGQDVDIAAEMDNELMGDESFASGHGEWTIVVGSEASQQAAETEASRWRAEGFRASPVPHHVGGATRYRIVLGQIASLSRAQDLLDQHAGDLPEDSWILNEPEIAAVARQYAEAGEPEPEELETADEQAAEDEEDVAVADESPTEDEAVPAGLPAELADGEPVASGDWTIVVGSETSLDGAEAAVDRWREEGYRSFAIPADDGAGGTRYRIALGEIASLTRAEELLGQQASALPGDSWILNEPEIAAVARQYAEAAEPEPEELETADEQAAEDEEDVALADESPTEDEAVPAGLPAELADGEPVAPGDWTIVVGSETSLDGAEAAVERWREEGFRAFRLPAGVVGERWYRVTVGQFATIERAEDLLNQYADELPDDSWIFDHSDITSIAEGDPDPEIPTEEDPLAEEDLAELEEDESPAEVVGTGSPTWTIVVGSEPSQRAALAEANRWRANNYRAIIIPSTTDEGQTLYRIAIGEVDSLRRAQELLERHAEYLPQDSWIYRYGQ